jgi:hypothetical protein
MNAKFYKQLTLKSDRQTIAARGPCGWQDGDAWAVVIGRNLDLCVSSRAFDQDHSTAAASVCSI